MRYDADPMRDLAILFLHLITTVARLFGPGGARSIVAESLLVKHQLLIVNRSRERAPNLRSSDRIIVGLCAMLMRPGRILRSAIVLRVSTILSFHRALVKRKYRLLFTPKTRGRPGPKGPSCELINAIVAMKQRNPDWGCPKIAQQISLVFGIDIDKDVVRRVLARHYRPAPHGNGPSWLTFLGHMKDSLWSVDMFRCESATLRTHWVLVVIDQYTRRIIGFAVHAGTVDGAALCRMFNHAIRGQTPSKYLSSDHDPLYLFHRWRANLRILDITEVKPIPYVPLSHPFVERLIGTVRRECLDKMLFWNERDLERKLIDFKEYYNRYRTHDALDGATPAMRAEETENKIIDLNDYRWKSHCRGLYQTPIAA
jgi:transposase InsO family protein